MSSYATGGAPYIQRPQAVPQYICGACSAKVEIRPKEPIRCKECGHRIVYKPRTTKMVCCCNTCLPRLRFSLVELYFVARLLAVSNFFDCVSSFTSRRGS